MDIGQRLKEVRSASGLNQEAVAEQIGVSRQTISNWENDRCYPDILSVIKLSSLYSISLDILLKEDEKMIEHLDESTNIVKSKQNLTNVILATAYLVIWALKIAVSILGINYNLTAYALEQAPVHTGIFEGLNMAFSFIIMPIIIVIFSIFTANNNADSKFKWLLIPLFFGIMNILASLVTFILPNIFSNALLASDIQMYIMFALIDMVISTIGIGIGLLIKKAKK